MHGSPLTSSQIQFSNDDLANGSYPIDAAPKVQQYSTRGVNSLPRPPHEPSGDFAQQGSGSSPSGLDNEGIETVSDASDEDAYVQTLHRMGTGQMPTTLSPQSYNTSNIQGPHVIEYFDKLSSISVLVEALGQRQERRLIQIDLPSSDNASAENREVAGLDEADVAYLNTTQVFKVPPRGST